MIYLKIHNEYKKLILKSINKYLHKHKKQMLNYEEIIDIISNVEIPNEEVKFISDIVSDVQNQIENNQSVPTVSDILKNK